ncbi:hypothetical protein LEP1GSC075_3657 [Leptospira interrogans str. Kito]|nr:hypothetical protein LEP1GSC069_2580 [Leptospira interrogans serovar Canicola str. Fiocruz LV133]EKR80692.1 hypothetical protein LEP1GSC099_1977 [Leptospira interrogans str. UI 08452]EMF35188.1 hypothetical protein LEP1GSC201_1254 [Leptospira interrogans serovar Pomona str. Fox 32256]EMK19351.1 hypothetical protein LEP1GSC075_3657 [Leptospira interrogans str. Kito]EMN37314.1 hypothetical protein LEP1GSC084_3623 [Leptospira interrogans serovar Medanensis str. L0448]EMN76078.1 hypothetical pr
MYRTVFRFIVRSTYYKKKLFPEQDLCQIHKPVSFSKKETSKNFKKVKYSRKIKCYF